jgi:nucleoside-diphosphate-sugar epimerase
MKKILISGSDSFVGKNLIKKLSKKRKIKLIKMNRKSGNVINKNTWANQVATNVLIYLAGKTYVPESWKKPDEFIETNIMGVTRALNYCKKNKTKMIYISSYMYGKADKLPTKENAKIKINNPLALSKATAEEICKFYSKNYGVKTIIIRPSNIYGPGQANYWLIPQILQKFKSKKILMNNLNIKRDLIYVEDFIDAIIKSIYVNNNFEIINIGSGKSYSIIEIIKTIQKISKKNILIKSKNISRKNEILQTKLDIIKAKKILNWKPLWNLEKGLKYLIFKK